MALRRLCTFADDSAVDDIDTDVVVLTHKALRMWALFNTAFQTHRVVRDNAHTGIPFSI